MEKTRKKGRTIKFYSQKNQSMVVVQNQEAREYARILENNSKIIQYSTLVNLDTKLYEHIHSVGIRKEYFEIGWVSDFLLYFDSGEKEIRELVFKDFLFKKATIEKLEFSRRYWMNTDIKGWKIIVLKEED